MRTGIAYETWRDCDDSRALATALDVLAAEQRNAQNRPLSTGPTRRW